MDTKEIDDIPFGFLRARFGQTYKYKHFDMDWFYYQGAEITHYTNLSGFFGIVESGGLWLSDHRFLNDSEEYHNGRLLALEILTKLTIKSKFSTFRNVLVATADILKNIEEKACYVCSLSMAKDSLDQWRAYSSDDHGVAITFNNSNNGKGLSHFFIMPIMSVSKVIYDLRTKTKILLGTISKFATEYNEDIRRGNKFAEDDWARELASSLSLEFINFKHPSFVSEQEVRLVVSHSSMHHFKGLAHRVGKGRIIPYLNSADLYDESFYERLEITHLPIKEVQVGPLSNQQVTIRSIEEYLANKGFTHAKVHKSSIPYRG